MIDKEILAIIDGTETDEELESLAELVVASESDNSGSLWVENEDDAGREHKVSVETHENNYILFQGHIGGRDYGIAFEISSNGEPEDPNDEVVDAEENENIDDNLLFQDDGLVVRVEVKPNSKYTITWEPGYSLTVKKL